MAEQTVTITLVKVTCPRCGCVFGLSEKMDQNRRQDHRSFYCPNGHLQYFPGESREERLQRELKAQRERTAVFQEQSEHFREQRDSAERSRAAIKGHMTRMKRRIANGVCPCCNRSFSNVRRHMRSKHPDMLKKLDEHKAK